MSPDTPTEPDDLAAAEFALGVLDGGERAAAEVRLRSEPAFAAAVERWRRRFAAMAAAEPAIDHWPAIAARLPANDNGGSLQRWRAAALSFAALAALLLVALVLRPAPEAARPLVAVLAGTAPGVVTVGLDPSGRLVIAPNALALAPRTGELWVIPADGRPRSLGVIDAGAPAVLAPPPAFRDALVPDALLAITVESPGGSPTGQPTTRPIVSGRFVRL